MFSVSRPTAGVDVGGTLGATRATGSFGDEPAHETRMQEDTTAAVRMSPGETERPPPRRGLCRGDTEAPARGVMATSPRRPRGAPVRWSGRGTLPAGEEGATVEVARVAPGGSKVATTLGWAHRRASFVLDTGP